MHILISCVGSAGDVHPFIAIGRVLARRGHDVELMTPPYFRPRIEAAGLAFTPVGHDGDFERIVQQPDLWHPRRSFALMWNEMRPRLAEAHRALIARVQPDRTLLVGSTLAWQVRLAQETHALPAVTVHLSPLCIFSAQAPAALPGVGDITGWPVPLVRLVQTAVDRGVLDRAVNPGLDAIRRDLGLAPVRRVMSRWVNSPQRVVCAWPDWFAPKQADWPTQAVTTGFARWSAAPDTPLDPALAAFLSAGPAPIGFTPGSAMAHGREFFARAVSICGALNRRAVLITPYADQLPDPLPPFAHAVRYAPFEQLLPRLAALVHHGGIGTTAQALAAGVPQGVVPFAHDQFDNAVRLVKRGVGVRLNTDGALRPWLSGIDRLLNDPAIGAACAQHAGRMAAEPDGADRIADQIEALTPR